MIKYAILFTFLFFHFLSNFNTFCCHTQPYNCYTLTMIKSYRYKSFSLKFPESALTISYSSEIQILIISFLYAKNWCNFLNLKLPLQTIFSFRQLFRFLLKILEQTVRFFCKIKYFSKTDAILFGVYKCIKILVCRFHRNTTMKDYQTPF